MTVATINSTVSVVAASELGIDTTSQSQYTSVITKVSEALEAREYDIVDTIAERANEVYGVSKREVADILVNAGLSKRPAPVVVPEPVVEQDEDEAVTSNGKKSKAQRIADLEAGQVTILEAITKLTNLAERHLNVSI